MNNFRHEYWLAIIKAQLIVELWSENYKSNPIQHYGNCATAASEAKGYLVGLGMLASNNIPVTKNEIPTQMVEKFIIGLNTHQASVVKNINLQTNPTLHHEMVNQISYGYELIECLDRDSIYDFLCYLYGWQKYNPAQINYLEQYINEYLLSDNYLMQVLIKGF